MALVLGILLEHILCIARCRHELHLSVQNVYTAVCKPDLSPWKRYFFLSRPVATPRQEAFGNSVSSHPVIFSILSL